MICLSFILSFTLLLVVRVPAVVADTYVIFGGTPAVVRTRMDPIISPGEVCTPDCRKDITDQLSLGQHSRSRGFRREWFFGELRLRPDHSERMYNYAYTAGF